MNVWRLHKNCVWNINNSVSSKILQFMRNQIPTLRKHTQILKMYAGVRCSQNSFTNKNKIGLFYYTKKKFTSSPHTQKYLWAVCRSDQKKENRNFLLPKSSTTIFHVRHLSEQVGDANLWTRVFLWMSESTPVSYAQDFLLLVHNLSGLQWWTTIILTTIFVRTFATFPLAIYQNYILAKVENLRLVEMPEIVKELKRETVAAIKKFNWTEKQARLVYNRSLKKQWNNLVLRDNCHPFKASILLWVQIPMWVCLSVALRNLVYMLPHQDGAAMVTYMELSVGGFGWIPNLLVPDESLVLPIVLGLINLAIVEFILQYGIIGWGCAFSICLIPIILLQKRIIKICLKSPDDYPLGLLYLEFKLQTMSKIRKETKLQKYVTYLFRGISVLMIPVAASVPSCLNLYWVTSSTCGLIHNLVLLSPRFKKLCKIPETPSQLENPYKHIATEIRNRAARIPTLWKFQTRN